MRSYEDGQLAPRMAFTGVPEEPSQDRQVLKNRNPALNPLLRFIDQATDDDGVSASHDGAGLHLAARNDRRIERRLDGLRCQGADLLEDTKGDVAVLVDGRD